jgi:hypothetical protein
MRHDGTIALSRKGDTLIVNGEAFDFAPLPEGGQLPAAAIASPWFAGPVQRLGGVLHLTLILPHGVPAPQATLFPLPVTAAKDGPIMLPHRTLEEIA